MSNPFTTKDPLFDVINQVVLGEKTLTDAEKKKREEIAQAMERENPGMDMGKKMAIATAQAKKVAEEVDLDEASAQARQNKDKKGELEAQRGLKNLKDTGRLNYDTNTRDAATREGRKMAKEEVETLDELSQMKLANYVAKAATSLHNNAKEAGQYDDKENANKAFKRWLGIKSAATRLRGRGELPGKESAIGAYPKMKYKTEEVEQIDELSKDTLKSYVKKAVPDMQNSQKRAEGSLAKSNSELDKGNESKAKKHYGDAEAAHERTQKRMAGIAGAIRRVKANEEIEQEDLEMFLEEYTTMFNEAEDTQQLMLLRAMAQDPSELMKMKRAIKAGDKALTNPILRQEVLKMLDQMMSLTTTDPSLLQRTRSGFQKKKMKMPEEVDQLDELSKKTLGSYIKKAAVDKSDRDEYYRHPWHDRDEDENYVKMKARNKGIPRAVDKLTKEEAEQVDEADEKEVSKEIKVARLKKDSSDFMASRTDLFPRSATSLTKHLAKKDDEKYGEAMKKVKDTPVSKFLASRKGSGKVRTEEVGLDEVDEAVRIRDRAYSGIERGHGDDKTTFQGKMDRMHIAAGAKARRKRTGPGVKGFNSAMRPAKASDGYQPRETGSVRAKNEEVVNEVAMPKNAADWQALINHQVKITGHPVATDAQFRAAHGKDTSKIASQEPPEDKLNYAAAQGGTVKQ